MSDTESPRRFASFEEFYPTYLRGHSQPLCRTLHYVGTTLTFIFLAAALVSSPWWLLAIPLAGYGFAWVGHFFVEKNRPETFTYPLWSLMGDYKMYFGWLTGQLPDQLDRVGVVDSSGN